MEVAEGDGRTIEARIIPYGETATICDPPEYVTQQERFAPGAFERQINAAHRVKVWLSTLHEQGLRGIIGHGETLEDRDDGVYATFRVHENADGDKALRWSGRGCCRRCRWSSSTLQSRRRGTGSSSASAAIWTGCRWFRSAPTRARRCLALREPPIQLPRLPPLPDGLAESLASRGFKLGDEVETSERSE